jgi:hypothetical protein
MSFEDRAKFKPGEHAHTHLRYFSSPFKRSRKIIVLGEGLLVHIQKAFSGV